MTTRDWWSLADLNSRAPDHHHDSTADNLATLWNASEFLQCFHVEQVALDKISQYQLHDDPDDVEGDVKIESIRSTIRLGTALPSVVLVHTPSGHSRWVKTLAGAGFYQLLEGRHRYNAAYRERVPRIFAWVAHIGCCGGPDADFKPDGDP